MRINFNAQFGMKDAYDNCINGWDNKFVMGLGKKKTPNL